MWWAWSVSCHKLQLKQSKALFRELQFYFGWQEWCPWNKKCDRILILLMARCSVLWGTGFLLSSSLVVWWLCSKLWLLCREVGGGESGYWSAGGIFRAITLMHLMSGCSDATSLPCVLAVKSWLNVISVYQVLQESQIIAKPVLALTDKRQIPLANFLRGWFSFCSH